MRQSPDDRPTLLELRNMVEAIPVDDLMSYMYAFWVLVFLPSVEFRGSSEIKGSVMPYLSTGDV